MAADASGRVILSFSAQDIDAKESVLKQLFQLSCAWFGEAPENPAVTPSVYSAWKTRLVESQGEILYCTTEGSDAVMGFIFVHDRDINRHIWLAVTNPDFLRRGVMSSLFADFETKSAGRRLTVNTYPKRFANMPLFLESRQFVMYDSRDEGEDGTRLMFYKQV
jgi:hypothetical protein